MPSCFVSIGCVSTGDSGNSASSSYKNAQSSSLKTARREAVEKENSQSDVLNVNVANSSNSASLEESDLQSPPSKIARHEAVEIESSQTVASNVDMANSSNSESLDQGDIQSPPSKIARREAVEIQSSQTDASNVNIYGDLSASQISGCEVVENRQTSDGRINLEALAAVSSTETKILHDECYHFGMMIASVLRSLPSQQRVLTQLQIQEVLYSAQYPSVVNTFLGLPTQNTAPTATAGRRKLNANAAAFKGFSEE